MHAASGPSNPRYNCFIFTKDDEGKLCKALYVENSKYYTSLIKKVDSTALEAEVMFLGYNDCRKIHFTHLRRIDPLPKESLQESLEVCYYSKDENRLLMGNIDKNPEEDMYLIKCKLRKNKLELVNWFNLNKKEVLLRASELGRLANGTFYMSHRISVDKLISDQNARNVESFEVPEELKVVPGDDVKIRKIKNKKIKKLKSEYKRRIDERAYRERQRTWNKFRDKTKNSYYGKSKTSAKEGPKKLQLSRGKKIGGIHMRNNRMFRGARKD